MTRATDRPRQREESALVPVGVSGHLLYTPRLGGLWTLDLSSGLAREIAPPPEVGRVLGGRCSPLGKQAAWSSVEVPSGKLPQSQLAIIDRDGSHEDRIASGEGSESFQGPVWGAHGKTLYVLHTFLAGERVATAIERFDISTRARQAVFVDPGANAEFDVSPDERWLVFTAPSINGPNLTLVDLASGTRRELVSLTDFAYITAPRFDRHSQALTFSGALPLSHGDSPPPLGLAAQLASVLDPVAHAHGLPQDLWTVEVSGGAPRQFLSLAADDPKAVWSPDESHLAILSATDLSIVGARDATPTVLLPHGSDGWLDWCD